MMSQVNLDAIEHEVRLCFIQEDAPEHLSTLERGILLLTQTEGGRPLDTVSPEWREIMRAAHTLKGGAGLSQLQSLSDLAHHVEDLLQALGDRRIRDVQSAYQLLIRSIDAMRLLLTQAIQGVFDPSSPILDEFKEFFATELQATSSKDHSTEPEPEIISADRLLIRTVLDSDFKGCLDNARTQLQHKPNESEYIITILTEVLQTCEVLTEVLNLKHLYQDIQKIKDALTRTPAQVTRNASKILDHLDRECQNVLDQLDRTSTINTHPQDRACAEADHDGNNREDNRAIAQVGQESTTWWKSEDKAEESDIAIFKNCDLKLEDEAAYFEDLIPDDGELNFEDLGFESVEESEEALELKDKAIKLEDINLEDIDLEDINLEDINSLQPDRDFEQHTTTDYLSDDYLSDDYEELDAALDSLLNESDRPSTNLPNLSPETSPHENGTKLSVREIVSYEDHVNRTDEHRSDTDYHVAKEDLPQPAESPTEVTSNLLSIAPSPMENRVSIKHAEETSDTGIHTNFDLDINPETSVTIDMPRAQVRSPNELTMKVSIQRLDELADTVGEMLISYESLTLEQRRLQQTNRDLRQRARQFYRVRERIQTIYDQLSIPGWNQALGSSGTTEFDPLEMDQFTDLHTVLQDFQELLARIEEGTQDIDLLTQSNLDATDHLRHQMGNLRKGLTEARMVPFSSLADRFRRPIWDLNQRFRKSVQLIVDGENTLIDRGVLEHLYDPMLHLIRNAFDHGIEEVDIRTRQGKPPEGRIRIAAYQKGAQIIILVQDDGQGVNFQQVNKRACQMGLVDDEQVSSQRLLQCLFTQGFSTAPEVSQLSGRGVGLDVVKAKIEKLRGAIQVQSSPHRGTAFRLSVPLTLNIMPLLVCKRSSSQDLPMTLAIPSSHILEITSILDWTPGEQSFRWRDQNIPLIRLEQILDRGRSALAQRTLYGSPWSNPDMSKPTIAIVLTIARQSIALAVNQLLGEQEMVLKTFDDLVKVPNHFPACTVLPSGQVVPVLAPDALEQWLDDQNLPIFGHLDPSQFDTALDLDMLPSIPSLPKLSSSGSESTLIPGSQIESPPELSLQQSSDMNRISDKIPPIQALHGISTIMVVDDSVAARRWMVRSLEQFGYQVIQCRDGQDALDTLNKGIQCHLVICDIEMPRLNGFQLLTQIRQHPTFKALPVAMLTSRQGDRHREQASQLGANGYFVKPLGGQQLLLKISNLINS